jgi:hypothetical protein
MLVLKLINMNKSFELRKEYLDLSFLPVVTAKMAGYWVLPFYSHSSHWFTVSCSPYPLFLASLTIFGHKPISFVLKFEAVGSSEILVTYLPNYTVSQVKRQ